MSEIIIRSYEPRDREAVRQICCDTADRGEPVENFFPDRELLADLVTRYYTDLAPHLSWVAECDGQVVGYLTGCLDTEKQERLTIWRIAPSAILCSIGRSTLFRRQTWRFARAGLKTLWLGRGCKIPPLKEYPAHFHVNLQNGFRGQRIGQRLVEKFFEQISPTGASGIRAVTRGDNERTCRFNERLGFVELGRKPLVVNKSDGYRVTELVIYGKRI